MTEERSRRLAVLIALSLVDGYRLPLPALREQLEAVDYPSSLDRTRTDCAWLAEQGLLTVDGGTAFVLTERGLDVATGRARVHGLSHCRPVDTGNWPEINQ